MHPSPPPGILAPKHSMRSASPGICIALWAVGYIGLAVCIFGSLIAAFDGPRESISSLLIGAISCLVLVGLACAIDKLDQIRNFAEGILENTQTRR